MKTMKNQNCKLPSRTCEYVRERVKRICIFDKNGSCLNVRRASIINFDEFDNKITKLKHDVT